MTNPLRNEVLFELGDTKLTLRPTFECLIEIEDQLLAQGRYKTLIEFVNSVGSQSASIKESIIILREASLAGGNPITEKEIVALVEKHGIVPIQMSLAEFLSKALYGGPQLTAEAENTDGKK